MGTPNLDSLNVNKRADYSSYNTAVDLLTALSDVIDENILKKTPVLTILTDESTNFIVHHKPCCSVVYAMLRWEFYDSFILILEIRF